MTPGLRELLTSIALYIILPIVVIVGVVTWFVYRRSRRSN